jgi:hypothetical protein
MQLNVLFWNVGQKDLTAQLVNLAQSREVDIFVLVESRINSLELVPALQRAGFNYFIHPRSLCEKITILTRFDYKFASPVEETNRRTIRLVALPDCQPFLLTALHLPDKRSNSAESQTEHSSEVVGQLARIETSLDLNRHIVVGDFNMNPFETGMVKTTGFHAVMSSIIAQQGSRVVQGQQYPYFYNPTWGLFGDLNKLASGTYYYRRAEPVCYEWNLFDQVLVRPAMIDNFVRSSLEIVQTDGVDLLLTNQHKPNKKVGSDHLPLFFSLTI